MVGVRYCSVWADSFGQWGLTDQTNVWNISSSHPSNKGAFLGEYIFAGQFPDLQIYGGLGFHVKLPRFTV